MLNSLQQSAIIRENQLKYLVLILFEPQITRTSWLGVALNTKTKRVGLCLLHICTLKISGLTAESKWIWLRLLLGSMKKFTTFTILTAGWIRQQSDPVFHTQTKEPNHNKDYPTPTKKLLTKIRLSVFQVKDIIFTF